MGHVCNAPKRPTMRRTKIYTNYEQEESFSKARNWKYGLVGLIHTTKGIHSAFEVRALETDSVLNLLIISSGSEKLST